MSPQRLTSSYKGLTFFSTKVFLERYVATKAYQQLQRLDLLLRCETTIKVNSLPLGRVGRGGYQTSHKVGARLHNSMEAPNAITSLYNTKQDL
jgi:hypothetical protein